MKLNKLVLPSNDYSAIDSNLKKACVNFKLALIFQAITFAIICIYAVVDYEVFFNRIGIAFIAFIPPLFGCCAPEKYDDMQYFSNGKLLVIIIITVPIFVTNLNIINMVIGHISLIKAMIGIKRIEKKPERGALDTERKNERTRTLLTVCGKRFFVNCCFQKMPFLKFKSCYFAIF